MRKFSTATSVTSRLRLLLVDDNLIGLLARKVVLEEQGFHVTACDSPFEALQCFRDSSFDLVVTDFRMPGMNGIELLAELRNLRNVPTILVSGMVEVLGLTEANTGADAVVAKNANEIANMVRALARLTCPKKPARSQAGRRVQHRAS